MTRRAVCICACLAVGLGAPVNAQDTACEPPEIKRPEIDRAVSLKGLERELVKCGSDTACTAPGRSLYDLTSIDGFVVDTQAQDIILVGHRAEGGRPLDLDDFVVMLRNALNLYARREGNTIWYTAPGVSIDPRPETIARLQELDQLTGGLEDYADEWPEFCEVPQDVRILGVPESRAAAIMLEADYKMKRFVNGQVAIASPGYASLSDLSLEAARNAAQSGEAEHAIGGLTRFWFSAGTHRVTADDDVIMLETANVVLLDEAEFLTREGEVVAAAEPNDLAREFSCAFSRNYRAIAAEPEHAVYADLQEIFRWAALARLMVDRDAFGAAGFRPRWLIEDYSVTPQSLPATLDGISEIRRWPEKDDPEYGQSRVRLVLPSCGGVAVDHSGLHTSVLPDLSGRLAHMGQIVTFYRETLTQVFWDVFL